MDLNEKEAATIEKFAADKELCISAVCPMIRHYPGHDQWSGHRIRKQ
ncbi:MAG: hypothetical protein R2874_02985 [Desulfobacterales bacterium]